MNTTVVLLTVTARDMNNTCSIKVWWQQEFCLIFVFFFLTAEAKEIV